MIVHTVCFALSHPAGSPAESEFLAEASRVLPAVPGVGRFAVSRQVGTQSEYRLCFSMEFASRDAYAAYDAHPDHRRFVAERWVPEVAAFLELDYEPYEPSASGASA